MLTEILAQAGIKRITKFCEVNSLPVPDVSQITRHEWWVNACAYYRPEPIGIRICLALCSRLATDQISRNWNWPGSTTDREPYGVICHELGHHADWLRGENKGAYWSEYSTSVFQESGEEKGITSYCENYAEWFAEMFRLFVTNHALLEKLRPRTYRVLRKRGWVPVSSDNWREELTMGMDWKPPVRIVANLEKKIKEAQKLALRREQPSFDIKEFNAQYYNEPFTE